MKPAVIIAIVLGILFLIAGYIYFSQPAKSLPFFFPGYEANLLKIHRTHAIGAFILSVCFFCYAYFSFGKKSKEKKDD